MEIVISISVIVYDNKIQLKNNISIKRKETRIPEAIANQNLPIEAAF